MLGKLIVLTSKLPMTKLSPYLQPFKIKLLPMSAGIGRAPKIQNHAIDESWQYEISQPIVNELISIFEAPFSSSNYTLKYCDAIANKKYMLSVTAQNVCDNICSCGQSIHCIELNYQKIANLQPWSSYLPLQRVFKIAHQIVFTGFENSQ